MELSLLSIVLLGIVEGLTEFLPVSSTGHLILAGEVMRVSQGTETFDIVIQLGAILAVVVLYRHRFAAVLAGLARRDPQAIRFTRNVLIGFLPSAVIGAVAYGTIKSVLMTPMVVAVALIVGGIAILIIERTVRHPDCDSVEGMSFKTSLGIGFIQCLSMIPGISRSGATIMGALLMGVERKTAAEFSFFLAVPTMIAATAYALWKDRALLSMDDLGAIAIGFTAAFLVALAVVKAFVAVVSRYGFAPFAWYRIALGLVAAVWLVMR